MNQAAQQLHERLATIRWQWLVVRSTTGTLATLTLAAGVLLSAAFLDNLCRVDTLRWPGGGLVLAAVMAGAWRWLWRPLRDNGSAEAASLRVEKQVAGLKNVLINGLQFSRGERHGSPEIVAAVIEDAARAAARLNPSDCVDRQPLR
ncbi:MAG: hypothetical protein WCL16_14625, partial [bacterium]